VSAAATPQPDVRSEAADVPHLLLKGPIHADEARTRRLVEAVMRRRAEFGLTRVGSITGLDRVGIPVVQAVRPLALSNVVTQGKGCSLLDAQASALMEALETWAAERAAPLFSARLSEVQGSARGHFEPVFASEAGDDPPLAWTEGWDLLTGTLLPVPLALVDTDYTVACAHPPGFPRTTTGLGAGSSLGQAVVQAGLEILERDAVARAHAVPGFFDSWQVDIDDVRDGSAARVLDRIRAAGLLAAAWLVPVPHELPVYWCQVMGTETDTEFAPLPASGFGCGFTHDHALSKALLEACQSRLSAISGAREDITRRHYPARIDREQLEGWRRQLATPLRPHPHQGQGPGPDPALRADQVVEALVRAGASAAAVVPLLADEQDGIFAVRLVAPPLRHASGTRDP
jgi:ribosomal protein S12 methylthiotransferase accessory factor